MWECLQNKKQIANFSNLLRRLHPNLNETSENKYSVVSFISKSYNPYTKHENNSTNEIRRPALDYDTKVNGIPLICMTFVFKHQTIEYIAQK